MGVTDIEFRYMTRFDYFPTDGILNDRDVHAVVSWTNNCWSIIVKYLPIGIN